MVLTVLQSSATWMYSPYHDEMHTEIGGSVSSCMVRFHVCDSVCIHMCMYRCVCMCM